MAELRVACPECKAQYRLKGEASPGAKLRCSKCGASFTLAGAGASQAAAKPSGAAGKSRAAAAGGLRQAAPAEPLAATRKSARARNWALIASIGAAGGLLVVCTVLATLLWTKGDGDLRADARPAAEVAPAVEQTPANEPAPAPPSAPTPPTAAAASEPAPPLPAVNLAAPAEANSADAPAAGKGDADAPVEAKPAQEKPSASASAEAPKYRWRRGDVLPYRFEISAELADKEMTCTGTCLLETSAWPEETARGRAIRAAQEDEEIECSGSAFVVHAEGYLATCAHVVEDATKITVQLGDQELVAEVVAVDEAEDLALLKVEAKGLKPLPLADSDAVQLGEDVRALGYPLSDVLGGNLKVTGGVVSGTVQKGESQRLQIDAPINPGNSGGPVINDRGAVVGVAASGLVNPLVSDVGFIVPANRLREMLAAQKLKPAPAAAEAAASGAALVAQAAESMALVKVVIGPPPARETHAVTFTTNSQTTQQDKNADQRFGFSMGPRIPEIKHQQGLLRVDEFGQLADVDGHAMLPGTLRCMKGLMVEPLDPKGRSEWEEEETITLTFKDPMEATASRFGGLHHVRPPHLTGHPLMQGLTFRVESLLRYRVVERRGGKLVIEKRQRLQTAEGEPVSMSATGKGTFTFDADKGCVTKMDYRQTVRTEHNNASFEIPVHITYELQSAAEFVADRLPAAQRQARQTAARQAEDAARSGQSAEEQVDGLLRSIERQLKAGEKHISQVSELARLDVVPSRQAKVAKMLTALVASGSRFDRMPALTALEKWADAACVPALLELLNDSDDFATRQIAGILGNLGDPRAAEPLAKALAAEGFGGFQFADALKKLGPQAENAVIPLLKHREDDVRRQACEILGEIGGPRSAKALEAMLRNERDTFVRMSIERTLKDIQGGDAQAAALKALGARIENDAPRLQGLDHVREVLEDRTAGKQEHQSVLRRLDDVTPPDEATRREIAALVARFLKPSEDAYMRSLAARALVNWGGPESEAPLLALLDGNGYGELHVYEALGRIGGAKTAERLLAELKKKKGDQILAPRIAEALGKAADAGPVEDELLKLRDDEDVVLRAMAIKALGGMETERARDAVAKALASDETTIELVAAIEASARQDVDQQP